MSIIIDFGDIWTIIIPYFDDFDDINKLLQLTNNSKYILNSEINAYRRIILLALL